MYYSENDVLTVIDDMNNIQLITESKTEKVVYSESIEIIKQKTTSNDYLENIKNILRTVHHNKKMNQQQKYSLCEFLYKEGQVAEKSSNYYENYQG